MEYIFSFINWSSFLDTIAVNLLMNLTSGEKPKEIRSLTGEVIDAKRMAELRKMK